MYPFIKCVAFSCYLEDEITDVNVIVSLKANISINNYLLFYITKVILKTISITVSYQLQTCKKTNSTV